jgi:hypothetical protein
MVKMRLCLITAALIFAFSLGAQAEEAKAPDVIKERGMTSSREHGMMEQGMKKVKPGEGMADCPLYTKMMHNAPMMVATSDGGVVVMAGGKLIKYDKNLAVVKEVSISSDKCCGNDGSKAEKKKIMMKTRGLNEAVKIAPVPAKK